MRNTPFGQWLGNSQASSTSQVEAFCGAPNHFRSPAKSIVVLSSLRGGPAVGGQNPLGSWDGCDEFWEKPRTSCGLLVQPLYYESSLVVLLI